MTDVCYSIKDGMHSLPNNSNDSGEFPILSAQNIYNGIINYTSKRNVSKDIFQKENSRTDVKIGDVLLTIVATIGRTAVVKEDKGVLLQRSVCVLKPNDLVDSRYLKYWLDTRKMQQYMKSNSHGSAQAGLYLNQVSELRIIIPTKDIQIETVKKIEKFDVICTNISSGLPAEIEARQKQYEYYRDKLLTFKEKE